MLSHLEEIFKENKLTDKIKITTFVSSCSIEDNRDRFIIDIKKYLTFVQE